MSGRSAADVIATAKAVRRKVALSSGDLLPAEFPQMQYPQGHVGVDGVAGVVGAFRGCFAGAAGLLAADEELAAAACGEGADAAPPASADDLKAYARVWAAYLDQDGAEPAESRALRKRGFTMGPRGDDGLVPVRGNLLPDVAAQLQLGFDSVLNPKVDAVQGPCFVETAPGDPLGPVSSSSDLRTQAQKRHDALAVLLTVAAASGSLPTLGGAAPTLVVSVREGDLAKGRGSPICPVMINRSPSQSLGMSRARERFSGSCTAPGPDRGDRDARSNLQPSPTARNHSP